MVSKQTQEFVDIKMDAFIGTFETFDARLVARANQEVYLPLSDKIAMFAIYMSQKE